ncbi:hypothetical protein CK203_049507 [Vitis vinifera]|uniref:Uncharacterized protein n=1 Tax=Vitis vinifera TaxID=29760 RepID=A0A438HBD2_VITVI|nr:hypothetical protein CK203_049507 [Vitis vinifera]
MTLGSISFQKAKIKVDRPFHYSPSAFQWSSGTTQFQQHRHFQSQWPLLKPFMEPFNQDKEELRKSPIKLQSPKFQSIFSIGSPEVLRLKRKHLRAPNTPCGTQAKQFLSISAMAKTKGAHAASPSTHNPRPRASPAYETRKPPTTPEASTLCPKRSVRRPPTKKAKVSGLGKSSAPPQPQSPATKSQIPSRMTLKQLSGDLWLHNHLLREIWIAEPGHSTPSYGLLLSQSSTRLLSVYDYSSRPNPNVIHFTIDGHHGILGARHIAEALHIPYELELPPGMLLVDVVLRSNIFPLQHMVKVHKKKLQRVDVIPLLFPRLLCQILEHLGYPSEPQLERHAFAKSYSLSTNGII